MAERDGRLKAGDKLLSVNRVSVANHSLKFAAEKLLVVPLGGIAKIGVCHPLPVTPDSKSDPTSTLQESPDHSHSHHNWLEKGKNGGLGLSI